MGPSKRSGLRAFGPAGSLAFRGGAAAPARLPATEALLRAGPACSSSRGRRGGRRRGRGDRVDELEEDDDEVDDDDEEEDQTKERKTE